MEIPVEKNKEYTVEILDHGSEGEGIAKIDNFILFIEGAIKGEICKIKIVKIAKTYAYGKLIEIIKKSENREEEDCNTYKRCGGCSMRHIKYDETLNIKRDMVQNLVNKNLSHKIEVESTLGMGNPYNYRNKAIYPVGINKENEPVIGVYAKRSHEIIQMRRCMLQNEVSEQIAFAIYKFIKENKIDAYNEKTREGIIRHLIIKSSTKTHEIMCILVLNKEILPKEKELIKMLTERFKEIKTIVKNINSKNTNVILGNKSEVIYGDGYIYDILGDYTFKISPESFYQVNPVQAEAIYYMAIEMLDLSKEDILYDLYCGVGTIGIFAAKYVKKVYGIEIVENAIKDAKENATLNKIDNIEFFVGDVEKTFDKIMQKSGDYPDAIILDPPRKGLDVNTIETILTIKPRKIAYISCNPATLVRDLKMLENKYEIKRIKPVDLFSFTSHVECVAVLQLKQDS